MSLPIFPAAPPAPNRRTMDEEEYDETSQVFADWEVTLPELLNLWGIAMVDALGGVDFVSTSTDELELTTGAKSLVVESGKRFTAGTFITVVDAAAPTANWLYGQVTNYNFETGDLSIHVLRKLGTGTKSAWITSLSGPQGIGGDTLPDFTGHAGHYLAANASEDGGEFRPFLPNTAVLGTLNPVAEADISFTGDWSNYENLTLEIDGTFNNPSGVSKDFTIFAAPTGGVWGAGRLVFATNAASTAVKGAAKFYHINAAGGVWIVSPNITGSGDSVALSTGITGGWRIAGGIRGLRILCEPGSTFTGTVKLYGDKINAQA
ncbi:hypothetical protein [Methylorubrum thiocyanatum]|uniref:hypothetical protein n=1 Tax=Methylorubrum thiocyanatum TaxID=47958 RepID=UPI0035C85917